MEEFFYLMENNFANSILEAYPSIDKDELDKELKSISYYREHKIVCNLSDSVPDMFSREISLNDVRLSLAFSEEAPHIF